jgi:hypothetical protein
MVSLPAGPRAGAAAAPTLGAPSDTASTRDGGATDTVPHVGTPRRRLPQQPPPRKGGLTEEVDLPAGPEARVDAAPTPILLVADATSTDIQAACAPNLGTLRRCRTR